MEFHKENQRFPPLRCLILHEKYIDTIFYNKKETKICFILEKSDLSVRGFVSFPLYSLSRGKELP